MIKNNIIAIFALCALIFTSCEDYRSQGLEPDMVLLEKSGLQNISAFEGGLDSLQVWAYKSGYNGTKAVITYSISQSVLDAYNAANSKNYLLLPESCYSIPKYTFELSGNGTFAKFNINYSPDKIVSLVGGYGIAKYALPLQITTTGVNVVEDKNVSILLFTINKRP